LHVTSPESVVKGGNGSGRNWRGSLGFWFGICKKEEGVVGTSALVGYT
jgi:hypothetical protein